MELRLRTDASERQAKQWVAGRHAPSGTALADLILSDAGLDLLQRLMEAKPEAERPEWWKAFHGQAARAAFERKVEADRLALERQLSGKGGAP